MDQYHTHASNAPEWADLPGALLELLGDLGEAVAADERDVAGAEHEQGPLRLRGLVGGCGCVCVLVSVPTPNASQTDRPYKDR